MKFTLSEILNILKNNGFIINSTVYLNALPAFSKSVTVATLNAPIKSLLNYQFNVNVIGNFPEIYNDNSNKHKTSYGVVVTAQPAMDGEYVIGSAADAEIDTESSYCIGNNNYLVKKLNVEKRLLELSSLIVKI